MKRQIQRQNKYSLFMRLPSAGGCCWSTRPLASELATPQNSVQCQHVQGWDFGDFKEDLVRILGMYSLEPIARMKSQQDVQLSDQGVKIRDPVATVILQDRSLEEAT